jgi:pilus assembly protein Flp/PilA
MLGASKAQFEINLFTLRKSTSGQSRAADDRIATKGVIMARLISRFSRDETAATAIEYSLIAGGIALAIVGVVQALGTQVKVPFTTVSAALK